MSDLLKVKIWKVFAGSNYFWITTLILYFTERGLTLSEALTAMSIYSFANVLLEYPTGVIGDHFSHKLSATIGTLLGPIFFLLLALPGNFVYYTGVLLIAALGISLISGSDTALLHSLSKDFKKDSAQLAPWGIILTVINAAIGSFAATIDIRLPLYLSAGYIIVSIPFLLSLKIKKQERDISSNIFSSGIEGLKDIIRIPKLSNLIVISSIWGALFLSIKWFYNPLFETINLPLEYWGLITSAALLLMMLGVKMYRTKDDFSFITESMFGIFCLILISQTNLSFIPLLGIWLLHIMRGYQDTKLGVEINDAITTHRRASILSFNNLLTRLISAVYITSIGFILPKTSFMFAMIATILAIGIIVAKPMVLLSKKIN